MTEVFTPQMICALIGGAIGSVRNFTREGAKPKFSECVTNFLVGEICASAAAAYFASDAHIALAAVVGLGAGAVGGYALDALQTTLPEGVRSLVLGWSERLGGKRSSGRRNEDSRD